MKKLLFILIPLTALVVTLGIFLIRDKAVGEINIKPLKYNEAYYLQKDYEQALFLPYITEEIDGLMYCTCATADCLVAPADYLNFYHPDIAPCSVFRIAFEPSEYASIAYGKTYFTANIYVTEVVVKTDNDNAVAFTYASLEKPKSAKKYINAALKSASEGDFTSENWVDCTGEELDKYINSNGFAKYTTGD